MTPAKQPFVVGSMRTGIRTSKLPNRHIDLKNASVEAQATVSKHAQPASFSAHIRVEEIQNSLVCVPSILLARQPVFATRIDHDFEGQVEIL
jgi:hypothetical protein